MKVRSWIWLNYFHFILNIWLSITFYVARRANSSYSLKKKVLSSSPKKDFDAIRPACVNVLKENFTFAFDYQYHRLLLMCELLDEKFIVASSRLIYFLYAIVDVVDFLPKLTEWRWRRIMLCFHGIKIIEADEPFTSVGVKVHSRRKVNYVDVDMHTLVIEWLSKLI